MPLGTLGWLHGTEIAAVAVGTFAVEVLPPRFGQPSVTPQRQIAIPNIGLFTWGDVRPGRAPRPTAPRTGSANSC